MFQLPIVAQDRASETPSRAPPRAARISMTDRCDMACVYCRPGRGEQYVAREERLEVDHWVTIARGLVRSGVKRIRITGGEPLLFEGITEVIARIAELGVTDLALTTNGSRLAVLAHDLFRAGLRRINLSVDSLDPTRFRALTRGGHLDEVLQGLDAAKRAGFRGIKTNTVVLRARNDDEIESITQWAWENEITPRFLELMFVGEGARLGREMMVPYTEIRSRIEHLVQSNTPREEPDRGPARYVQSRDGRHRVGFITGSSDTFCDGCDRIRVTTDGTVRPCLSKNDGVNIAGLVRAPDARTEARLQSQINRAWASKPDGHWKGCTEATAADVSMRGTGG